MTNSKFRTSLLSGASVLVLTAFAPGMSKAADIDLSNTTFLPTAQGFITVAQKATNTDAVSATSDNNTAAFTDNQVGVGDDPSVSSVTGNLIGAYATGNNTDAGVSVSLINDTTAATDPNESGIGILTNAINTASITASASTNSLNILETDFTGGTATNAGNLITAQTTVNTSVTDSIGEVPNAYVSTTDGIITLDSTVDPVLSSTATIATGSTQINTGSGGGSLAVADANTIDLIVTPTTAGQLVVGSLDVSDNTISSNFTSNRATSDVSVEAGGSPTFEGSIAVSNVQQNAGLSPLGAVAEAATSDSTIAATVGRTSGGTGDNTLMSSLAVSNNSVTASATGNSALASPGKIAGNQIIFEDPMNVTALSAGNTATSTTLLGDVSASVDAGLSLFSLQANQDDVDGLDSLVSATSITTTIQNMDDAAVASSDNLVLSQSRNNTVSNAILAPGINSNTANFTGSAALLNRQTSINTDLGATVTGTDIEVVAGNATATGDASVVENSTIVLANNRVASNAISSQVSNSVALGGVTVDVGGDDYTLSGGGRDDGTVSSTAGATLTNYQSEYFNSVASNNTDTTVSLNAADVTDAVSNSNLRILGSASQVEIEAVAVSSSASNFISIDGVNITGSVGLNNLQNQEGDNETAATVTDPLVIVSVDTGANVGPTGVTGSTVEIMDITTQALAYGATASNALTIDAGAGTTIATVSVPGPGSVVNVDLNEGDGSFFDAATVPTVTANYGLLSGQNREGDVTASIMSTESVYQIVIGDDTAGPPAVGNATSSDVMNDGNAIIVSAFGNQVTNDMSLSLGTLNGTTGDNAVANVTNVQTLGADAVITAEADTDGASFSTNIAYTVENSTVSVSGNTTQAQAFGNRASTGGAGAFGNRLTVEATILDLTGDDQAGMTQEAGGSSMVADAAFSVQNAQSGADTVIADLGLTANNVGTSLIVGGDVLSSTLAQDRNNFFVDAFNNQAVNELTLTAVEVATTAGINNFQVTSSTTQSSTGAPGAIGTTTEVPVTSNKTFTAAIVGSGGIGVSATPGFFTVTGGEFEITGLTDEEILGLVADGWSPDGPGRVTRPAQELFPDTYPDTELAAVTTATPDATVSVTELLIVTATPANKAVSVSIGGNSGSITDSFVSVDLNRDFSTTVANDVVNRLSVDAGSLSSATAGLADQAVASNNNITNALIADADLAVNNYQQLQNGGVTTAQSGSTLNITVDAVELASGGAVTSGSMLSVSGNVQQALAVGNRAVSDISAKATNLGTLPDTGASTALLSTQLVDLGEVLNATSWMDVSAPASMQSSGLEMSNNVSNALATFNQAINTTTVTANNIARTTDAAAFGTSSVNAGGLYSATADHALTNIQEVLDDGGAVNATATLNIANQELGTATVTGIQDSAVSMSGNSATSQATSNNAQNTLNLNATNISATGAVANVQLNAADANADTTGQVLTALSSNGGSIDTVSGSSVTLDSNTFTANARGNQAVNALNAQVGASYASDYLSGADSIVTTSSPVSASASGAFAVLNNQGNTGAIFATVTGAVRAAFDNANGSLSSLNGSVVSVSGNTFASNAIGNFAQNTISASARPGGTAPMSMTSMQNNSGAITASSSGVTMGVTLASGLTNGSSSLIGGNSITSSATGNSVRNRIVRGN